ncbi:TRAFs-binding domain-containing protein [Tellurirhabdus rosea]|uniref:TRAFs-binding domain-containing protein n=1 Tax=Tellurirhabdus rosea TaxID=2674997 RepID=UPI00224CC677|nr:TRAFs-binding domain-containing protein [Tellurirhabdus rosea]
MTTATKTAQKTCFVVMGFGKKTDLATGRKLDLDKSYHALIKPVVEAKGMICIRADEILHSGPIDLPMYQQLLTADIVVADLSTANLNAFYELGIRHALRPRTTIVISEDQLGYPFDLNHILINKYTHLGENIDYFEVIRFQKHLGETLEAVLNREEPDSPVYTFLDDLIPPSLRREAEKTASRVGEALAQAQPHPAEGEASQTLSFIIRQGEDAIKAKNHESAKNLFRTALTLVNCDLTQRVPSSNAYLVHRLALATYRAQTPTPIEALKEANQLLDKLDLAHTNDSETVVLAGAIEKKLYESGQGDAHLKDAILYFQRGFYLHHNRYNGINLAYLLNCRAQSSLNTTEDERLADRVWANRTRRDVLEICEQEWDQLMRREMAATQAGAAAENALSQDHQASANELKFWILVNKAEACFGLGMTEDYTEFRDQAEQIGHEPWMMKSFTDQIERLKKVL